MIPRTLTWIKEINKEHNIAPELVLEVGSKNKKINRSLRQLFPDSNYVGIDIRAGQNVNRVLSVYDLTKNYDRGCFDAVLCLYVLEHLKNIWLAVTEMNFVLKKGGFFYIAVPGLGYSKHEGKSAGGAKDYWRATEEAVREMIMDGYDILSLEHARSAHKKLPVINCLGVKK